MASNDFNTKMFTFLVQELASAFARESVLYDMLRRHNLLTEEDVKTLAEIRPPGVKIELNEPGIDLFVPFFERFMEVIKQFPTHTGNAIKNESR